MHLALLLHTDLERLRSQAALAAFLSELGEAVEQAELVHNNYYDACRLTICSIITISVLVLTTTACHASAAFGYAVHGSC